MLVFTGFSHQADEKDVTGKLEKVFKDRTNGSLVLRILYFMGTVQVWAVQV